MKSGPPNALTDSMTEPNTCKLVIQERNQEQEAKALQNPLPVHFPLVTPAKYQHLSLHFLEKKRMYINKNPSIWDASCLTCRSRSCAFLPERSGGRWWRGGTYTNCRPFSSDWSRYSGKGVCRAFADTVPRTHLQGEAAWYGGRSCKWVQPHQRKRYSQFLNRMAGSCCQGTNPEAYTTYCGHPGSAHHWWRNQWNTFVLAWWRVSGVYK